MPRAPANVRVDARPAIARDHASSDGASSAAGKRSVDWSSLAPAMLSREELMSADRRERLLADYPWLELVSSEEMAAKHQAFMAGHEPGADLWVFAYGSLIWNPTMHIAERRVATLGGYHRSFCLWADIGRGCREYPGLFLGLDRGGQCRGVALKIKAEDVATESRLFFEREIIRNSYIPRWFNLMTDDGPIRGVGLVVNRAGSGYAGRLSVDEVATCINQGKGHLGACSDYFWNTHEHLMQVGIHDRGMLRIARALNLDQKSH